MSRNEEAKKDAERRVSDELANQPKQNGAGTEESKERRADAEKTLTDKKTGEATTKCGDKGFGLGRSHHRCNTGGYSLLLSHGVTGGNTLP